MIKTGLLGQTSENWSHLLLFGLRKLKIFIFLRENLLLKFMHHFGNVKAFVVGINLECHLKIDVFRPKKNSRHNYCKCLVFLQRMLIFISKIMDILIQIQKKICWEPIFRFFLRGQHSTNFKKKYKSTHFNFTVYSTRMTEEELWLHNALLDVQFCGNVLWLEY